ncbi:hypothetical protein ILUMI_02024 [Ignelater luminosus]|uniref:Uncharacterized protein n=1 Tax=Ignelater luminosus TaxID=2038154 RepID=A0A8K0DPI8_IGNLU|nr:hypothetical protein ILUMI_02024 [Ignelater luminosus]
MELLEGTNIAPETEPLVTLNTVPEPFSDKVRHSCEEDKDRKGIWPRSYITRNGQTRPGLEEAEREAMKNLVLPDPGDFKREEHHPRRSHSSGQRQSKLEETLENLDT